MRTEVVQREIREGYLGTNQGVVVSMAICNLHAMAEGARLTLLLETKMLFSTVSRTSEETKTKSIFHFCATMKPTKIVTSVKKCPGFMWTIWGVTTGIFWCPLPAV